MAQLNIYKASAGSGKTFRLTLEYIKLLFINHDNFKFILAVTFTNKATGEMKNRIIEQLYDLSKKNTKNPYLQIIKEETKFKNDDEIFIKAGLILNKILHNFSFFNISTIDSFFQKILRSFIKEIGINFGYDMDMDKNKAIEEAIDNMIQRFGKDEQLTEWILWHINDKISEGKTWDLSFVIKKISDEIFKEKYKLIEGNLFSKIESKQNLKEFIDDINKNYIKKFEIEIIEKAQECLNILDKSGLKTDDFSGGSRSFANYFNKILKKEEFTPSKTNIDAINNVEKWYAKKSTKIDEIKALYDSEFREKYEKLIEYYFINIKLYNTALAVNENIYTLGLFQDISEGIKKYKNDNNKFLISEVGSFINEIIRDNDTPFIYEKIGNVFKYFMIDEFQDTSEIQWSNFLPLISNSLAQNYDNLIVGDIKQSIYRWRNGDWNILLEKIYDDLKYQKDSLVDNYLIQNRRSSKSIIEFNNALFNYSKHILKDLYLNNNSENSNNIDLINKNAEKIIVAYKDVEQEIIKKDIEGYVNVSFFEKDKNEDELPELYNMVKNIEELQLKGYDLKDIVILVRSNKEIECIADYINTYSKSEKANPNLKYDIISNEGLKLSNGKVIKLLISLLKYIYNPEDIISKCSVVYHYSNIINDKNNKLNDIFNLNNSENYFKTFLPNNFTNKIYELQRLSLFELIEQLIKIFGLNSVKGEFMYLQGFQNKILEYLRNSTGDIGAFIEWWEEYESKFNIILSELQDAIQILTVHKSKGLEYKAVFIPFCNWNLDGRHDNTLWASADIEPFNLFEQLPVKYNKITANSYFEVDYLNEALYNYIDNFNVLYVALTRAENVLFISAQINKSEKITQIGHLIYNTVKNNEILTYNNEKDFYYKGQLIELSKKQETTNNNYDLDEYISENWRERVYFSQKSSDFFKFFNNDIEEKINYGKLMHDVFSKIKTLDDIDSTLTNYIFEGSLIAEEVEYLKCEIQTILNIPKVKEWFNDEWIVKTEKSLITKDRLIKIPDRVLIKDNKAIIIDFKFGEEETTEHIKQVREYMENIQEMGYKEVEGFLLYGKSKAIVCVG